jgi:hypothetical protein
MVGHVHPWWGMCIHGGASWMYNHSTMPRCTPAVLLLFSALASYAQNRSTWQALAQVQVGDRVRLSLKSRGSISGTLDGWTPEQITVNSTTEKRENVTKLERYRKAGWSRRKTAAVGALIGGGAGAAVGIAGGGCASHGFGPCFTRGQIGAALGALGAVLGAVIGALIPHNRTDVIYVAR